ncbi:MAG: SPOR domain-containing protein [Cyanobacteriota bacterium]
MNPKLLVGLLFIVTFAVSFIIYLLVVNIITPHIDLSSTTKSSIEVGPELNEDTFNKRREVTAVQELQEKAMQDSGTYETDISSMLKDSSGNYIPGDQAGDSDENLPGVLDNDNPEKISVPGEESGRVSTTTTTNSVEDSSNNTNNSNSSVSATGVVNDLGTPVLDNFTPDNKVNTASDNQGGSNKSVSRVVVGSYSSIDEAKKAYDNMVKTDIDVAPIIKEIDGNYTLQVGAFTDKQKAQNMADKLKDKNYSATIKSE